MLLQRIGAILSDISLLKNADLEVFAVPIANNMEAIWAVKFAPGKLYTRLSTKRISEGLI